MIDDGINSCLFHILSFVCKKRSTSNSQFLGDTSAKRLQSENDCQLVLDTSNIIIPLLCNFNFRSLSPKLKTCASNKFVLFVQVKSKY